MERLPTIAGDSAEVSAVCRHLIELFEREPFLTDRLPSSRAVVAVVCVLRSHHDGLLVALFPFVIAVGRENPQLHCSQCILGIVPYLFEYSSDAGYSTSVREHSVAFLHQIYTARPDKGGFPDALPMFIAAGGLLRLARIVCPVLGIVYRTFILRCRTPKSCLARAEFLELLSARFRDVRGDEPSLIEIFSSSDAAVKCPMAPPSFFAVLFTRARAS
jgi:hypothetical protein